METNKDISFEEALDLLEKEAEKLRSGQLGFEESVDAYGKCVEYHKLCKEKLEQVKQKIEIYRPDTGTVESFEEI